MRATVKAPLPSGRDSLTERRHSLGNTILAILQVAFVLLVVGILHLAMIAQELGLKRDQRVAARKSARAAPSAQ